LIVADLSEWAVSIHSTFRRVPSDALKILADLTLLTISINGTIAVRFITAIITVYKVITAPICVNARVAISTAEFIIVAFDRKRRTTHVIGTDFAIVAIGIIHTPTVGGDAFIVFANLAQLAITVIGAAHTALNFTLAIIAKLTEWAVCIRLAHSTAVRIDTYVILADLIAFAVDVKIAGVIHLINTCTVLTDLAVITIPIDITDDANVRLLVFSVRTIIKIVANPSPLDTGVVVAFELAFTTGDVHFVGVHATTATVGVKADEAIDTAEVRNVIARTGILACVDH
jgi:hypothetical protein